MLGAAADRWWLVCGEAGAGKTALCRSYADALRRAGSSVVSIAVPDPGTYTPLWPIARISRMMIHCLTEPDRAALWSSLPPGWRPGVERFINGGDIAPPDATSGPAPTTGVAWFAVFEAVAAIARWVAERVDLVVVIDDAHRVDDSSARTFQELARELEDAPMAVVVAAREPSLETRPAARAALDAYRLLHRTRSLVLEPLSRTAAAELAAARGYEPDEDTIDSMYATSEGNPLFLTELIDGAVSGTLDWTQPQAHLGPLVRREVARLPLEVAALIRTAAVLGSELTLFELSAVAADSTQAAKTVRQAEEAGLLRSQPESTRTLEFRHQIVRDAVVAGLPESERARIAEDAAAKLEQAYGSAADTHAERLAALFARGYSPASEQAAVRYAVVAAARSAEASAWEESLNIAVDLLSHRRHLLSENDEAEVLRLRGSARYKLGDRNGALADLYEAFRRFVDLGAVDRLPSILSTFSYLDAGDFEIVDMAEKAVAIFPPESPAGVLAAMYHAAGIHHAFGDYERAARLMEAAFPRAESLGDANIIACGHSFYVQTLMAMRRFDEARYHLSFAPPPSGGVPDARLYHNLARGELLLHEGKPDGTRMYHENSVALSRDRGDDSVLGPAYHMAARAALRQGDFEGARELAQRALWHNRFATGAYMPLIAAAYHTGDVEAGDEAMNTLRAEADTVSPGRGTSHTTFATLAALRLITTGEPGFRDDARRYARSILAQQEPHPQLGIRAGYALAEIAHAEWVATGRASEQDLAHAEQNLATSRRYSSLHDHYVQYALGLLFRSRGRTDEARELLQEAVALADGYSDAPVRPWMRARLGAVLEGRDPAVAFEMFHAAYAQAESLGMGPLLAHLESHLILSPRELETLRLVADGLQAKEIADRLAISVSTVQNHIQQIFRKTKTGNRVEAVRWARRSGLLPDVG